VRRSASWFGLAALSLLHAALTFHFDPPDVILSAEPLSGADFDTHYGQTLRFARAMDGWGRTWSYDPSLLAGRPAGALFDCDNKGWQLFAYALHRAGAPLGLAFNLFLVVASLSAPLLAHGAARLVGLPRSASLAVAVGTSLIWFFDSQTHYFWWIGMVSWALASHVALVAFALFLRYLRAPSAARGVASSLVLGLTLLIHPFAFVALSVPMTVPWFVARRSLTRRADQGVLLIAAGAVGVNLFWLLPALRFAHYLTDFSVFGQAPVSALFQDFLGLALDPDDTGLFMRTGLRFLAWAAAAAGLAAWRRAGDPRFVPFAVGVAWLVALAYLGRYTPVTAQVQPYRFVVPATLLALFPAAAFVTDPATRAAVAAAPLAARALLALAAVPALQLLATDVLYFFPGLIPRQTGRDPGGTELLSPTGTARPIDRRHARLPPGGDSIPAWFAAHRELPGRVMVEPPVVGEHLASRVPGIEVLGGIRERCLDQGQSDFFRRDPDRRSSAAELAEHLERYAVRWVVLRSDRPFPGAWAEVLRPRARLPDGVICDVATPVSLLGGGAGLVRASTNELLVTGTSPREDVVLRYHFLETLRCEPDCRLAPEPLPGGAAPQIRIPAPHPEALRIFHAY